MSLLQDQVNTPTEGLPLWGTDGNLNWHLKSFMAQCIIPWAWRNAGQVQNQMFMWQVNIKRLQP